VPLAALQDDAGAYLGERCAVLHATGAVDVLPQAPGSPGPPVVAGDPAFDDAPEGALGDAAGRLGAGAFAPLPEARAEAVAIGLRDGPGQPVRGRRRAGAAARVPGRGRAPAADVAVADGRRAGAAADGRLLPRAPGRRGDRGGAARRRGRGAARVPRPRRL